jgi:hypothetical protein
MSLLLLQNGSLLVLAGLLWGTRIHSVPHPRIALSTHITLLQHGSLNIVASYILTRITLSPLQTLFVSIPHLMLWGVHFIGIANAWWGADTATKEVLFTYFGSSGVNV